MGKIRSLGRHIITEYRDCKPEILNNVIAIEKIMTDAALKAGATVINTTFHHFSPWGVSGVVVIQESHLAIHTWPEYGYASVDLYTCGDTVNPWLAFKLLKKALSAKQHEAIEMLRGQPELLNKTNFKPIQSINSGLDNNKPIPLTRDVWFTERTGNFAFSVKHNGGLLHKKQTSFQLIEIYETPSLGKMLVLDGIIVLTEKDEYVYHEMLSHPALFTHKSPSKVLILGGGDGGTAREVLKHQNVRDVTLVELDEKIIEVSKRYFPQMSTVFDNKKLKVQIENGIEFIISEKKKKYDVIIMDLGFPITSEDPFYSHKSFKKLYKLLNKNGVLIVPIGSPMIKKENFKDNFLKIRSIFGEKNTHVYLAQVPTYPSGSCGFVYCNRTKNNYLKISSEKKKQLEKMSLKYFNKQIHKASFALPNYLSSSLA